MTSARRWIAMPVAALVLVGAVVGVQLRSGGGSYEPLRLSSPCSERAVTPRADGLDGLTERLVLYGIDDAACRLGVSREELTLDLARSQTLSDTDLRDLREGLRSAVLRMDAEGTLPPVSDLVDEALGSANLNSLLERLIRALPDSLIDSTLTTDDVLTRAIGGLDLRELLTNLDDRRDLQDQIAAAVTQAVKDSLEARLRELV